MHKERHEPTWPFLVVLGCLFVLSATAPRAWQTVRRAAPPHMRGDLVQAAPADQQPGPADPVAETVNSSQSPSTEALAQSTESAGGASDEAADVDTGDFLVIDPHDRVGNQQSDLLNREPELLANLVNDPPADAPDLPTMPDSGDELAEDPGTNDPPQWTVDSLPDEDVPELGGTELNVVEVGDLGDESEEAADPAAPAPLEMQPEAELAAEPLEARPAPFPRWSPPAGLLERLESFAEYSATRPWVEEVRSNLEQLGPAMVQYSDHARPILNRLGELVEESAELQNRFAGDELRAMDFRQVRYSLIRRLNLYQGILRCGGLGATVGQLRSHDRQRLLSAVDQVDTLLGSQSGSDLWRRFFRLEEIRELAAVNRAGGEDDLRAAIDAVLARLDSTRLEPAQVRFLQRRETANLLDEFRAWQASEIALDDLLAEVEHYESETLPSAGRRLVLTAQRLRRAGGPSERLLGETLGVFYENANVRFVVSAELMNRLTPPRDPELQWVDDTILGAPVWGESVTQTDVRFRMIPDRNRARLALVVEGEVYSATQSERGPAMLYNDSVSRYFAEKEIEFTPRGLTIHPARIEVDNHTQLRDVETTLDPIPILGSLAKEIARDQVAERHYAMTQEIRAKVARRAKVQVDGEADQRLSIVDKRLQERVLEPLATRSLGPAWLSSHTTDTRMVLRWRLAGDDHPGGHTLRPWAPADSLASCQIHQSAINNFIDRLNLDATTYRLPELQERLCDQLNLPLEAAEPSSEDGEVVIRFADHNAAFVEMDNGRLGIALSIAELRRDPYQWQDFQVRAYYRPQISGNRIELVRDGVVQLRGQLDMRSQIALRGVFSRTFSKNRPWDVTPEFLQDRPEMSNVAITQLLIDDGWIGVALGPKVEGRRPLMVERERQLTR